ncbi:MAG: hypothetical protein V3S19_07200 [Gemmatimonadales bacterium]
MVARFIHSILRANVAIAADGDLTYDLPVNPLSVILLNINPLNETSTIANYSLFQALLSAIDNVQISHKGASVINASGADLAALAMLWHGMSIWQSNAVETDDDRRSLILPIMFGRRPYMPSECFPETKKGELQMTVTWDIADTGFDGLRMSVETIELPDATPDFVQKFTTLAQTFAATGQNDIDLPIGNPIRAILMHGTTSWAGATPAPTLGQLSVFLDNLQVGYTATDWEVLRGVMGLRGVNFPPSFEHIHSGTYTTTVAGDSLEPEIGLSKDAYYALLDFDPTHDDLYTLETEGAGRVNVRSIAEAAEAVRACPIEKVAVRKYMEG